MAAFELFSQEPPHSDAELVTPSSAEEHCGTCAMPNLCRKGACAPAVVQPLVYRIAAVLRRPAPFLGSPATLLFPAISAAIRRFEESECLRICDGVAEIPLMKKPLVVLRFSWDAFAAAATRLARVIAEMPPVPPLQRIPSGAADDGDDGEEEEEEEDDRSESGFKDMPAMLSLNRKAPLVCMAYCQLCRLFDGLLCLEAYSHKRMPKKITTLMLRAMLLADAHPWFTSSSVPIAAPLPWTGFAKFPLERILDNDDPASKDATAAGVASVFFSHLFASRCTMDVRFKETTRKKRKREKDLE